MKVFLLIYLLILTACSHGTYILTPSKERWSIVGEVDPIVSSEGVYLTPSREPLVPIFELNSSKDIDVYFKINIFNENKKPVFVDLSSIRLSEKEGRSYKAYFKNKEEKRQMIKSKEMISIPIVFKIDKYLYEKYRKEMKPVFLSIVVKKIGTLKLPLYVRKI